MKRFSHSDFIREMQRLHDAQRAAIQSRDVEAIEHAAHEMTVFLRLNAQGRVADWFASRSTRERSE